jgi:hypothetical protein
VRFEVLRRDGHTCRYCGAAVPDVPITVDHVVPRALGGSDDPSNLVAACRECNSGKAATSPDEHVVQEVNEKALLWADALRQAAEARRAEFRLFDEAIDSAIAHWDTYSYDHLNERHPVPKGANWRNTLDRFLSAGLDVEDLTRFIDIAMGSRAVIDEKWRYFCGCCWKEINTRQEMAVNALSEPTEAEDEPVEDVVLVWDDGYRSGYNDGYRAGCDETTARVGDDAAEAYERGFRVGASRREAYDESVRVGRRGDGPSRRAHWGDELADTVGGSASTPASR